VPESDKIDPKKQAVKLLGAATINRYWYFGPW
jgi:hypothetical protein